jgi:2-methylcitrate dehydratase PrpD
MDVEQDLDRIQRIDVTVSPFFSVLCEPPEQKRRPKTAIDAKFSIPFTVAVALGQGDVTLRDFSERLAIRTARLATRCIMPSSRLIAQSTRGVLSASLAMGAA